MNTKKSQCKRKHSMLDPTNIGVRPNNGIRYCKACARLQVKEWRERNKMERPKTNESLCFVCQEQPITHTVIKGTEGSKGSEQFGVCEMCGAIVIEENDRMNALKKAIRHADSRRIFTYVLGGDLNPIKIQLRRRSTF